jgi:2-oxoglutarate ferredoxin oxidoreductase subunit beta
MTLEQERPAATKVWGIPSGIGVPEFPPETNKRHQLCPGCGESVALQVLAEVLEEEGLREKTVCAIGIGCYSLVGNLLDVDIVQSLHGRATAVATGIKRTHPDLFVLTLQGDGDMTAEGALESFHAAARGERITSIMLNNGGFMETGCHVTPTTLVGQHTKDSAGGRDAGSHGYPVKWAETIAALDGAGYVARAAHYSPVEVKRMKKFVRRAVRHQMAGGRYGLVEALTSCPTGWLLSPVEALRWQRDEFAAYHTIGEKKAPPAGADA